MITIDSLLKTDLFRGNQSFLAEKLGISRNTLRKYMNDVEVEFHFVRVKNGKWELFVNQTNTINGKSTGGIADEQNN